jgi:predicted 3-demethylubiquinone-9 3-methyltransferase (glyoxalase superfamily)
MKTLLLAAAALLASCASAPDAAEEAPAAPSRISPFLMFTDGGAADAMAFYASLFDDAEILQQDLHGPDGQGVEGTVLFGVLRIAGQRVLFTDAPPGPDFGFNPSFSLFVDCEDEEEIERLFATLSEGGMVMMPLQKYDWSDRFAWVQDKNGLSWQLNLDLAEPAE